LQSFYGSEAWQKFRMLVISQHGLRCEYCHEPVARAMDLTLHHIKGLTPENVNDALISLNPDNVMVVHFDCHNRIHSCFGYQGERGVYIVFGAPLSGKKTYVQEHMRRGDMVVDMDRLYVAVSCLPYYDKPENLFNNVIGMHNMLTDHIWTRYGKWNSAWVIGGYADKYKRERLADDLCAELVFCDVSKDECLRRLDIDEARQCRKDEWIGYINKWFEQYTA
jgi:hypothetical protein